MVAVVLEVREAEKEANGGIQSRYHEDVQWCMRFNCTVYNKGHEVQMAEGPDLRWRQLPNIGREAHTWLAHIEKYYDALADTTVFMQGDPFDHFPIGINVESYINSSTDVFLLLTGVVRADLSALAFRDGYAPFRPFTGRLQDERHWAMLNAQRIPVLLQPLGLWGAREGYNKSEVAVKTSDEGALPNMLRMPLHWILQRAQQQRSLSLADFWLTFMQCKLPSLLYHAQGGQFSLSRHAIQSRPRTFYRALLDHVIHIDPVSSYYLELMWWYIFDENLARSCVRQA